MALIKCKECKAEVSSAAKACPKCGHPVESEGGGIGCGGILVILFIIGIIAASMQSSDREDERQRQAAAEAARAAKLTPEQKAAEAKAKAARDAEQKRRDDAVNRAAIGARILKKSAHDPERFKLESALVIDKTASVCYEFRAPNAFGGLVAGRAVLSGDGKNFLTNTDSGFASLWNRECAGKTGQEVATAIRWFAL